MSQATRSRAGIGATALLGLVLAATAAVAQDRPVTTTKEAASTVKVNVSGDMVTEYIGRSREVTAFTESFSNPLGLGNAAGSEPETTFEGHVAMRIAAELSEKIGAVIEFGTRRLNNSVINEHDGENAQTVHLREAHVMLNELFTPELRAQLGMTTWSFNPRGRGGSLAFDPRHSQTITRNYDSNFTLIAGEEAVAERLIGAGFVDELQTMGVVLTYTSGSIMVDLVLLPGIVEGGRPNGDEALYALDLIYNLDNQVSKGSRVGVIAALHSFQTSDAAVANDHSRVYTVGGGGSLRFMDGALEVYAEGYAQFGEVAQAEATAAGDDVDAAGTAFQVGLEWRHQVGNPMPIWLGANFTLISGDGDDAASADNEAERFSAYESVSDLMIIEDQYYGYDWDSNMQIIKLNGGLALSVGGGKDNLEISVIAGFAKSAEDVATATGGEDAIGNEFDIKIRWLVSKQASITLAYAMLTGSDILEEAMGGAAGPQSEDNAYLWSIGANLRF
jgi:hypothetical protein